MLTVQEPVRDGTYALPPAVVLFAVDDGSARLFDLDGAFYALSSSAAEMLQGALTQGVEATITNLAERYEVAPDRIRADISALLDDLARRRLIECAVAPSRRSLRQLCARVGIGPVLRAIDLLRHSEMLTVATLIVFARACTAIFGWGPSVEAWRAAIRPKAAAAADGVIERIDDAVSRTAGMLPTAACKERALACWYMLCSRGLPASLIVGVQLYPMAGHCWCELGDRVLTDSARRCAAFVPIIRYRAFPSRDDDRRN